MNNNHKIPALDKAVSVLEYLGRAEQGVSQAELAKALNITTSTCYRILQTLLVRNWVRQEPGNLYDVSNGILTAARKLVNSATRFECLQPILEKLAVKTGLSCKLSIRQANAQITILRAESPAAMTVSGKVGANFPIVEGSTGAALLDEESLENIQHLMTECTDDIEEKKYPELVNERLNSLKKNAYCMNAHPNRWNVEAMAASVKNKKGQTLAAITILGFVDDFADEHIEKLAVDLQNAILECTQIL